MKKIILASQSPRRKQLLEWAEVDFDIIVPETDESYPPDTPTQKIASFIAQQKALTIVQDERYISLKSHLPILAADTIVVCNNQIIGKPKNSREARETLTLLSGQKHEVITGVTIISEKKRDYFRRYY